MTEILGIKAVVAKVINKKLICWKIKGGLIVHQFIHSEQKHRFAQGVFVHAVARMAHRTDRKDDFQIRAHLQQFLYGHIPLCHNLFHIQTYPVELEIRDFMTIGNDQVAGNEFITESGAEGDEKIIRMFQKIGGIGELFVNIPLKIVEILA